MKNVILGVSLLLNILLIAISLLFLIKILEGCAETPNGKIGVLKKELDIGRFNESKKIFTLPKGLVVKDMSASGMGWFEPNQFRIVVTSGDPDLVDYTSIPEKLPQTGEFYSADIAKYK